MTSTGEHPAARRGASTALASMGVLLLGVVVVGALWSLDAALPTVVLGDYVPRPWHGLVVLLTLAVASLVAAAVLRPCQRRRRRPMSRVLLAGRMVGIGLLALVAAAATAVAVVVDDVSDYHVLEPASVGGCRVVVEERSALLLGSGVIYLLPAGGRQAREVHAYAADDGYRPVTFGTYSLRWRGEVAELDLRGTQHQPVTYDPKPLAC